MKPLLSLLCVFSLLLGTAAAHAKRLEDAEHAMREGDYAVAYCIMRPFAEAGDAESQYNLGWMYQNGYGLAINNSLALEWWSRASEQGHTDASFAIANLYNHGEGQIKRDTDKSIDYYLLAALDGHEDAILILRSMMTRDDKVMRKRSAQLIKQHAALFGPIKQVRVKRVNVRQEASLEAKIVTRLDQGEQVVELRRKGKWSQAGILNSGQIAWIYAPLLEAIPAKPATEKALSEPSRDEAVSEEIEGDL